MKTLDQLSDGIRREVHDMAHRYTAELEKYPDSTKKEMYHITETLRRSAPRFSDRVAAEIIHFATSP